MVQPTSPRKWSGVPVLLLIASDPRLGAVAGTLGPVEAWVDAVQAHSSLGGTLGVGEHHQVERHCRSGGANASTEHARGVS